MILPPSYFYQPKKIPVTVNNPSAKSQKGIPLLKPQYSHPEEMP